MTNPRRQTAGLAVTAISILFSVGAIAQTSIAIPPRSFSGQGGGNVGIRQYAAPALEPSYIHYWYTPGHWLEWEFEAPAGGAYGLRLKYSCRFDTTRKAEVNGEVVKGLESVTLESTAGWIRFTDVTLPGPVTLKTGRNVLRITCLDDASLSLSEIRLFGPGKQDVAIDPLRFTGQGGGRVQAVVGNDRGYLHLWDRKGHWLEWSVNTPADDDYRVIVRYSALKRPVREVRVNGQVVPGMEAVPFESSGGWQNWVEGMLPSPLRLQKGMNTLRLTNISESQNLTAIILRGSGGWEAVIPAISFNAQGGGTVTVWQAPKFNDAIYLWDEAGHWLEWTVEAPVAGRYEVTMRYATDETPSGEVRGNGAVVSGLAAVALPKGARWDDWQTITLPEPVSLRAGRNLFRMTNVSGGRLNLAELVFTLKE